MKTFEELSKELKLNQLQSQTLKVFITELVIDLLEKLRDENISNFNETIDSLKKI